MGTLRIISIALGACAAVWVLYGCESSSDGSVQGRWTSEREERGDTVVVRTITGSVWGDTMALVPDLVVGELEGSPETMFGRIASIDVDSNGRLFILDAHAREVRIFSHRGDHERTFGRPGGGPGEFRGPDQLRVLEDGRIIVRDQSAASFSVFSAEGAYLGRWPRASGFSTTAPFFVDENGRVVNPSLPDRLVAYDLDGTAVDTIPLPALGYNAARLTVTSGGGRASYSIPFMPSEHWTMSRDGSVLIGVSTEYAVQRRGPNGQVLRIERIADPVPVQEGEAARAREQITRRIRTANDPGWRWQGPDIPSTKPVFQVLQTGVDGSIWVFREKVSVEEENPDWDPERPERGFPTRWRSLVVADVFDENGRYLGPVNIPESMSWFQPSPVPGRDWIWAATIHELGYPQVVRFRIDRGGPTGRSS